MYFEYVPFPSIKSIFDQLDNPLESKRLSWISLRLENQLPYYKHYEGEHVRHYIKNGISH